MLLDVIEEHLNEGAFLWTQWERALASPRFTMAEVAGGPEERLEAHLDGLSLAGAEELERMLSESLGGGTPAPVFAAASALLAVRPVGALERALAATEEQPEHRAALIRAMALCRRSGFEREVAPLLESPHWSAQAAALEALAFRRIDVTASLRPFVRAEPALAVSAVRAARGAGPAARSMVDHALASTVPDLRDVAIETGLLLGFRSAWSRAREVVEKGEDRPALPLTALAMSGDAPGLALVESALDDPRLRHGALGALGAGGTVRSAELCLAHLEDPLHGRLAGEAFSVITGLAIAGELERQEEEPEEPVTFEEDDLDADLRLGPDDELPLPEADEIRRRWQRLRAALPQEGRLLGGRPFALETLLETLARGPMRRRRLAALELWIRSRGECAVETRAWARDQQRSLAAARLTVHRQLLDPFSRLLQA